MHPSTSTRSPAAPGPDIVAVLATVLLAGCTSPPPSGPRLLVTSAFTDEVLVLDPADGEILERVPLDPRPDARDEPRGLATGPDGVRWYATTSPGTSTPGGGRPTLWAFRSGREKPVARVGLPARGAVRVDLSPDGTRAAVPDGWLGGLGSDGQVVVVGLDDMEVRGAPAVCPAPGDARFDPAGRRIAVACELGDEVVVLDAERLEPVARFPVAEDVTPRPGNPRQRPGSVAWSPSGNRLYVSLMRTGRLAAFTPEGEALWSTRVGDGPTQLAVTPGGGWVVVTNRGDQTLALVDTETHRARALRLPDALHPHGLALAPDGRTAWVAWEGTTRAPGGVMAIDLTDGEVLWRTQAGLFTVGVAYVPG